jgi:hypothetical protein
MTGISVRKEIVVQASQVRAFSVFTDRIDRWWPREHHIGTSPLKRCVIEGKQGGRWYSTCEDGSEVDVGRVVVWDSPKRVVLTWQITAQWQYDRSFETEVEVNFIALGPNETRVTLEHHNLERFGPATEQIRPMFDSPDGWSKTLAAFAKVADAEGAG